MTKRIIGPYLEQQILSASPLQLINLSYQTAIQAVREARSYLEQKKIPERVRSISLAHGVLAELYRSLDFKAGSGEISKDLGRLYDYMMRRLLDANAKQSDEPLAEVLGLLCSMSEVWAHVAAKTEKGAALRTAPTAWGGQPEATVDSGSLSYSLSC